MAPTVVYPRADSETNAHARHRWAHPDVEYRIPGAVVQGGAWPFRYELLEGPTDATIGSELSLVGEVQVAGPDYGIVRWTPAASEEGQQFDFRVGVTDQDGTTVEATWSVTVDASRFLFVAPSGDDGGAGTIAAPLQSAAGWYGGDADDATHAGKLVYFREGQFTPLGDPSSNDNLRIEADTKPLSFMAYPGESVVFDSTGANWTFWDGCDDVFFSGIHFEGSKLSQPDGTPIRNARTVAFYGTGNQHRITFFENTVSDIEPGNPADADFGNDNPAFVWRPSTGTQRGSNWAFVNNTFDTAGPRRSNGPSCVSLSCVGFVVYEGNEVRDWEGTGTFFDKSNNDHVTQRNNDLWSVGDLLGHALGAGLGNSYDPTHLPGEFETCWNRIRTEGDAISVGRGADGAGPVFAFRNSVQGDVWYSDTEVRDYEAFVEGNAIQGELLIGAPAVFATGDNHVVDPSAPALFDDEGSLTGAARAELLGTHGAEVQ